MKTIILAAGFATRLYPLTKNFPKPLLKVGGKAILDWLIEDLEGSNLVDEYLLVSNHRFTYYFEKWAEDLDAPLTILDDGTSTNETRLGAVRDIQFALEKAEIQDDVLVLAGDNLLNFSLVPFLQFGKKQDVSCVMCYEENDPAKQQRTAIVTLDEQSRITSYEEKPLEPKSNLAVPPFYFYKAEDIRRIPEGLADGCGYDAPGSFAAWLSARTEMKAYKMPGSRYDIGNLESYEQIRNSYKGVTVHAKD